MAEPVGVVKNQGKKQNKTKTKTKKNHNWHCTEIHIKLDRKVSSIMYFLMGKTKMHFYIVEKTVTSYMSYLMGKS